MPKNDCAALIKKFKHFFSDSSGLGKLKGKQASVLVQENAKPVAVTQSHVPLHLRKSVDVKLECLEADDIIEKVDFTKMSTLWVHRMVIVPKGRLDSQDLPSVRVTLDLRALNNCTERFRYPIPTCDEVLSALAPATHYSKIDLQKG